MIIKCNINYLLLKQQLLLLLLVTFNNITEGWSFEKNRYTNSQICYFTYLIVNLIKNNKKLKSLIYLLKKGGRLQSLRKIEQYCKRNLV